MATKKKQYSAQMKFRVSLEAAKGNQTISEIGSKHKIHPTQVSNWKQQLLKNGSSLFEGKAVKGRSEAAENERELYEQIGRLKMELEWLKKNVADFS